MYIEVPKRISEAALEQEFGAPAARFYIDRIKARERQGFYYRHPLRTAYIWAAKDRHTNQGYYSTWHGFRGGRKKKNHGGS